MREFVKMFKYREIDHPEWKYELTEDYFYASCSLEITEIITSKFFDINGTTLLIKKGYTWNGASGAIDTNNILEPSLIHDVLYQAMEEGLISWNNRKDIDKYFYKLCLDNGMSRFRAWYVYQAVRKLYPIYAQYKKLRKS